MSDKVGFLLVRVGAEIGDGTDIPYGIWVGRIVGALVAVAAYEVFSRIRLGRPREAIAHRSPETLAIVVGTAGAGTGGGVLAFVAGVDILLSVAIGGAVGVLAAVFIRAGK